MQKEDQIIGMLEKVLGKLDEHGQKLQEHSQMLTALRSGQENTEFDGIRIENEKEFGELKEDLKTTTIKLDLLRDDIWTNKVDIHRIKNTIGMK